ncbi:MAG: AAA family ATPase [Planctomycetia bacterium]|nr:AAA family ATPase [Planctomycetia bacterium]
MTTETDMPAPDKGSKDRLPGWYPDWATELADLYFSGSVCLFVLHGNVHDLVRCPGDGEDEYCDLSEFLTTQVFGKWDLVLGYDLGRGLRPRAGSDSGRLKAMQQYLTARWGEFGQWPREPDRVLPLLDSLIERILVEDAAGSKSVAVLLEYAQYLVPAGDVNALAQSHASRLVRLLNWAQNPRMKQCNMAVCLVVDRLGEINDRLVESPHVAAFEVPLPDRDQRLGFIQWASRGTDFATLADFSPEVLADVSNGLSLTNLNVVLSQAVKSKRRLDSGRFRELKKTMIERQCRGLVEFVEPEHTLDLLVGHDAAKKRLKDDADLIGRGQLAAAPMGYLVCGPVGTGKTFLAECYAGSIGIPCLVLKNFRSKYVGETESNLQQVLAVLRSLGPVVVIVDEADAALGNRHAEGDSGTSARTFSMIASQMGNTRYRGQIIWMLLTSRPDLLPIDLKRQGRAEVHIPLFYPAGEDEIRTMFQIMAKKNKVTLAAGELPKVAAGCRLSGADVESIVLGAQRSALAAGREQLSAADLQTSLDEFIPSVQGLEKELQEIAAVLECTQQNLLPAEWRERITKGDGRSRLQERMVAIRQLLEE